MKGIEAVDTDMYKLRSQIGAIKGIGANNGEYFGESNGLLNNAQPTAAYGLNFNAKISV